MKNQIRTATFIAFSSLCSIQAYAQDMSKEPIMVCAAEAYSLDALISALIKNGTKIPPEMSSTIKSWSEALVNSAVPDTSDSERGMAFFNLSSSSKTALFSEIDGGEAQSVVDARVALVRQCMTDHIQ